jgi:hypothetical protein
MIIYAVIDALPGSPNRPIALAMAKSRSRSGALTLPLLRNPSADLPRALRDIPQHSAGFRDIY